MNLLKEYSSLASSSTDKKVDEAYNEVFKNLKRLGQEGCLTSFINIVDPLKRKLSYVKNVVICIDQDTKNDTVKQRIKEFQEIHSFEFDTVFMRLSQSVQLDTNI
mmetsp:Transcript_23337/g.20726  ORF Transcript_23337/g.20726 Transcript_23337/m.20726 type:complete len:105 (+) Transcript_23337:387-701(+)